MASVVRPRGRDAKRRPCHLEAEVFELMTRWIERCRTQAEERFRRLDALLAETTDDETAAPTEKRGEAS